MNFQSWKQLIIKKGFPEGLISDEELYVCFNTINKIDVKLLHSINTANIISLSGNLRAIIEWELEKDWHVVSQTDNVYHYIARFFPCFFNPKKTGNDTNQTDQYGDTFWHHIAWSGNLDAIKWAILKKKDLDERFWELAYSKNKKTKEFKKQDDEYQRFKTKGGKLKIYDESLFKKQVVKISKEKNWKEQKELQKHLIEDLAKKSYLDKLFSPKIQEIVISCSSRAFEIFPEDPETVLKFFEHLKPNSIDGSIDILKDLATLVFTHMYNQEENVELAFEKANYYYKKIKRFLKASENPSDKIWLELWHNKKESISKGKNISVSNYAPLQPVMQTDSCKPN